MRKTLRKRCVIFAMTAVTILLVVLIGAINVSSWIIQKRQSEMILHTIAEGEIRLPQMEPHDREPFFPPMSMDTVKSARFFMVRTDADGTVRDMNIDQISSVTAEQAVQYAGQVTRSRGRIGVFRYEVRTLGTERLIFFMDSSSQLWSFMTVLCLSCGVGLICWVAVLAAVIPLSGRVIRPILMGMEKQKQFITNAGHELKTPLAIIQSNNDAASLIYGETKYSRNIRQQTKRLNMLMTNLLTLAKLDEELRLPTERVDISSLIGGLLPEYEERFAQKQITLTVNLPPDIRLEVHRETFSQMVSILLDNAVKYTPTGGDVAFRLAMDGEHVELTEENTCRSAGAEEPERLFERFYRGNSARTQDNSESGYGIGLSAARSIAELFDGTLRAQYTANDRIRFTARF